MIIPEKPEHFDAVRQLTMEAFASSTFGHQGEADLIETLRECCADTLSLVAIVDQRVVGHILFSRAEIREPTSLLTDSSELASPTRRSPMRGMGLAPMSVHPSRQRSGIGSMLVNEGLRRLDELGNRFTIVAGHPDYYPRFGFRPAKEFSVSHGFAGMPQEVFFLRTASPSDDADLPNGLAYYHAAFGPQHETSP
ncbi:GNAT family N-acetyltransferase [Rhodopirellula sp. P2]|uniref:GNAT family N-acetyltransferase n=1 Tax=Rhodopirellula sp. P2 TaxID=2127060 RepID=UPI00236888CB|nr:N-acetyltransferase [Rhodopirellula sp. P2]WDQ15474.1 N-acetyltransferase [Rhodopirellula sp. P2]